MTKTPKTGYAQLAGKRPYLVKASRGPSAKMSWRSGLETAARRRWWRLPRQNAADEGSGHARDRFGGEAEGERITMALKKSELYSKPSTRSIKLSAQSKHALFRRRHAKNLSRWMCD
jgi:hypothetical protein